MQQRAALYVAEKSKTSGRSAAAAVSVTFGRQIQASWCVDCTADCHLASTFCKFCSTGVEMMNDVFRRHLSVQSVLVGEDWSAVCASKREEVGSNVFREGKRDGKGEALSLGYQSEVSILGPVGYGPTTLPLRHSDARMMAYVDFFVIIGC